MSNELVEKMAWAMSDLHHVNPDDVFDFKDYQGRPVERFLWQDWTTEADAALAAALESGDA